MLSLHIFDRTTGATLADCTAASDPTRGGSGYTFTTNAHGFSSLQVPLIPMSMVEAFSVYTWPGTPYAVVTDNTGGIVWEGRVEDISIVSGGVALTAFGYQRAYSDVLYTGLWSKASTADWKQVTETDRASATPQRYETDNNNRLYIAPRNGEAYGNDANYGELTFTGPASGVRDISTFSCDYSVTLPANWDVRIIKCKYDFSSASTVTTLTATGSNQTGTFNLSSINSARLIFSIRNNTGSAYTLASDSGNYFARLTNLRVKTTSDSTVTAATIANAMASYVNSINSEQAVAATRVVATSTDLKDETYLDMTPADILNRLAYLHACEWAVWEGRVLSFQERGATARSWMVDATDIVEMQRSLNTIQNVIYAGHRDAAGNELRTATASDAGSIAKYGVRRYGMLRTNTTSATEAATHRDLALSDRANAQARAKIKFNAVYTESGGPANLWEIRSGDVITIRNLPTNVTTHADSIRDFTVMETSYNAGNNTISVSPYVPTPTLDLLVARQAAGFRSAI